jgi:hypothetical protein
LTRSATPLIEERPIGVLRSNEAVESAAPHQALEKVPRVVEDQHSAEQSSEAVSPLLNRQRDLHVVVVPLNLL